MGTDDTGLNVRGTYERSLAPGEAVFDQGDPGDHLYVIRAGEVELVREAGSGRGTVARLGPGDFFGGLKNWRKTKMAVYIENISPILLRIVDFPSCFLINFQSI